MSTIAATTRQPNQDFKTATRILGVATGMFAAALVAFGWNYYNLLTIRNSAKYTDAQILSYNYIPYIVVGVIALFASFLTAWVAISQSKTSPIVTGFVIILVGWLFGIMASGAIVYLINDLAIKLEYTS